MNCPGCGKANDSDKKFCIYCGTPLIQQTHQATAPPTTSLEIACPLCQGRLLLSREHLGQSVECPLCHGLFQAPKPPVAKAVVAVPQSVRVPLAPEESEPSAANSAGKLLHTGLTVFVYTVFAAFLLLLIIVLGRSILDNNTSKEVNKLGGKSTSSSTIEDKAFLGKWGDAFPTYLEECPGDIVVQGGKITYSKGVVSINVLKYDPALKIYLLKLAGNDCFTQGGNFIILNVIDDGKILYISSFETERDAISSWEGIQKGGSWHYDGGWDRK